MIKPNFNIKQKIEKRFVNKLSIKDIGSLSVESFTNIIEQYKNNTIIWKINPQVKIKDLEEYLSGLSTFLIRILNLIDYLIFILTIIISFVYSNYIFSIAIPIIIFFSVSPRPFNYRSFHYFNLVIIALLFLWGFKIPVIGYLCVIILVMRLIKLFENWLINKALFTIALLNENVFKTFYLRNILMVSNGKDFLNSEEEANEIINKFQNNYSSELTHYERLYYCKQCNNKGSDIKNGIICNLTNKRPDFKFKCDDFKVNKTIEKKVNDEYLEKRKNLKKGIETIDFGSNLLYLISGLILISNSYFFTHLKFIKAIGPGILEFLNVRLNIYEYYFGFILSAIFLGFGLLSKFKPRIGFISGLGLYSIDAILSLLSQNYYSIWIHFVLIIWIGNSLKQVNDSKEIKTQEFILADG